MDREQAIGLVLITLIFIGWFYWSYQQQETYLEQAPKPTVADTVKSQEQELVPAAPIVEKIENESTSGNWLTTSSSDSIRIETAEYLAVLSEKGARLVSFRLKHYLDEGQPVELLKQGAGHGLNYRLKGSSGEIFNTEAFPFEVKEKQGSLTLTKDTDSLTIVFEARNDDGRIAGVVYRFYGTGYRINHQFYLSGWQQSLTAQQIEMQWNNGLRFTEKNKSIESQSAESMFWSEEKSDYLNATATDKDEEIIHTGSFNWTSIRNKYFAVVLGNTDNKSSSLRLYGRTVNDAENHPEEIYNMVQFIPFQGENYFSKTSALFITPLDYYYLKDLDMGLHNMMSLGLAWVVKPISEYFVLPLFIFLHDWIPSWGIVIIVFTLLIKILLYPLTESQTAGFKKMAAVAPMMKEIQEKYGSDKEKQQQEMLKLYREHGYNPLGGCLPLLLQMPILFALYTVFANAIEFRQAEFLWISDLSLPDTLVHLPFSIPIYGAHISLLAALVAGSQIIQMKMQPQTNAEQAAIMMWVFPVMMLLIFNNLSSGLNLYYFLFNVLTLAQTYLFNQKGSSLLAKEGTTGKS